MSSSKANSFGQQMLDEPDEVEKPLRQKEEFCSLVIQQPEKDVVINPLRLKIRKFCC